MLMFPNSPATLLVSMINKEEEREKEDAGKYSFLVLLWLILANRKQKHLCELGFRGMPLVGSKTMEMRMEEGIFILTPYRLWLEKNPTIHGKSKGSCLYLKLKESLVQQLPPSSSQEYSPTFLPVGIRMSEMQKARKGGYLPVELGLPNSLVPALYLQCHWHSNAIGNLAD